MSLLFDDSDIAEKDEEINMEKIDYNIKEKEQAKNKKNNKRDLKSEYNEDLLDKEALMNIPTKSLSVKKKSKNISKVTLKEIYDTSLEGVEIPILNNNINNGSLMLTELLDLDNNNSDNKSSLNLIDEKEKEKERIKKNN